mgnify:CR=1 FL=1|tara:strand:- start:33 stop:320 length:288 start_codon:yes stop_codon:yes gene_type:complete
MEVIANQHLEIITNFIYTHEKKDDIIKMFRKGPDPQRGFMWSGDEWWSKEERIALKIIGNKVLDLGWDSSGYGYMMRLVEFEINKKDKRLSNKEG